MNALSGLSQLMVAEPPLRLGAAAEYPWSDDLAKRFTFVSRFGEPYVAYRRRGDRIFLPRNAGHPGPNTEDTSSTGAPVDLDFSGTPRNDEQARVWQAVVDAMQSGRSGLVEQSTGGGKTVAGALAAAMASTRTLVLVPKEDLLSQWHDTFQKFLGLEPSQIGLVRADKVKLSGKKVALGLLQSLAIEARYPQSVYDWAGLLIADEAHKWAADQMSNALFQITAKQRLALTATPNRADGKDHLLHLHFGPTLVRSHALVLTPKVILCRTPWVCPRVRERDPLMGTVKVVRRPHQPGKLGWVLGSLAEDVGRNKIIVQMTTMSHAKGRVVIIFCALIEHVERLMMALQSAGIPGGDIARYVGGMSEGERAVAQTKRVMVATFGMMAEGTDIPRADTAILASPRSDVVQIAGRVLREHPDKKAPVIVDLVDEDSPVLAGYARKRRVWYKQIGAEVVQL